MKYTIALFSLLAVASAASLPNTSPGTGEIVARHEGHGGGGGGGGMQHGNNGTEDKYGLERRKCRRNCSSRVNNNNNNKNTTSDATALLNSNVGALVAGVAGAIFLY
jgi:hypothetical protein